MAIPIAEGSINKQFQAPRAAKGKAVDLSQNIQQIGQQTINAIQGIQQFSNAQEEMTANDAITLYSTQMNNLNLELRSKKGLDAVNFESEYKKKASQYHSEFINRLGGLNSNVQNSAINKINSFNTSNKNEFVLYTEGQRMEAEKESSDAAKQALSSLHLAQFDNTFVDNKAVFYDATAALDEMVLKDCLREGMASDPTYVRTRQEEERVVFAGQVVKKLNRQGDYRRSMRFIEDIKGQIPEPDRVALGHDASLNQLKVEVLSNPEKFANKAFTDKYVVDKNFPYLEELERKQLLASLQKTNKEKSNLDADQKKQISDINAEIEREAASIFFNLGIADSIEKFKNMYSEESLSEMAGIKDDANKYNVTLLQDAIDELTTFKNAKIGFQQGQIVRDGEGKLKIYKTAEEEAAALNTGVYITDTGTNNTLDEAISFLRTEMARLDREGKYGNVTERQAFFKGKDPTVKEVLDMNIGEMITEMGNVPWWRELLFNEEDKTMRDSAYTSARYIAREAAKKYLEGIGFDLNQTNSKLSDKQRKEMAAHIAAAFAVGLPEGMLKEFGIDKSVASNVGDINEDMRKRLAKQFFGTRDSLWLPKQVFNYAEGAVNPLKIYKAMTAQAELAGYAFEGINRRLENNKELNEDFQ